MHIEHTENWSLKTVMQMHVTLYIYTVNCKWISDIKDSSLFAADVTFVSTVKT